MLFAGILLFGGGLFALVVREINKSVKRENTLEIVPLISRKCDSKTGW